MGGSIGLGILARAVNVGTVSKGAIAEQVVAVSQARGCAPWRIEDLFSNRVKRVRRYFYPSRPRATRGDAGFWGEPPARGP